VVRVKDKKGAKAELKKKEDTGPKVIGLGRVKKLTQADLMTGGKKKAFVNIQDDMDFPDLDGDGDDPFAALDSGQSPVIRAPAAQKKAAKIDESQWGLAEQPK